MSDASRSQVPDPGNDLLERATESLRSIPSGENPPPELLAATVAALQAARTSDVVPKAEVLPLAPRVRTWRKPMLTILKALAALLFVTVTAWFLPVGTSQASFTDVQAECGKAKNVQCTMVQKLLKSSPEITFRLTIEDHGFRMDFGDAGSNIYDLDTRKGVQLLHLKKQYRHEGPSEQGARPLPNFLEDLLALPAANAEKAPSETLDGKNVDVFRLKTFSFWGFDNTKHKDDQGELTVWVNPTTKLPVKVEMRMYQDMPKEWSVITMKDLKWNVELPAGFFDMKIPAGYTELPPIDPRTGQEVKPAGK